MYAVIETGGKQYRVEVGTELQVELLDVEPGKTIVLERVLLVADGDTSSIGRPLVADAAVSAEVVRQIRGEKLISFKYRPKARSRVKKGHRQELTVLRISDITESYRQDVLKDIIESLDELQSDLDSSKKKLAKANDEQSKLRVENLAEQRRITDVRVKFNRLLADVDLLVVPRATLFNVIQRKIDRKSTRLNSSHGKLSRMPSSA